LQKVKNGLINLQKVADETNRKTLFASHLLRTDVLSRQYRRSVSHYYKTIKQNLLDFRKEEKNEYIKLWIDEYIVELDIFIEQEKLREERDVF
jgi:glycerol-3-phosphate dehydrogenase